VNTTSGSSDEEPRRWSASSGLAEAVAGYAVGVIVPTAVSFAAVTWWIEDRCGGISFDCSWGFEYLLVVLVFWVGVVLVGPIGCVLALRIAGERRVWATGWRCVVLSIVLPVLWGATPSGIVAMVPEELAESLAGPLLLVFVLLVAAPGLARMWAMSGRGARRAAEREAAAAAANRPAGTTWESAPPPPEEGRREPGW
jgi:hypothetical protein